jgi:hypothetical protein
MRTAPGIRGRRRWILLAAGFASATFVVPARAGDVTIGVDVPPAVSVPAVSVPAVPPAPPVPSVPPVPDLPVAPPPVAAPVVDVTVPATPVAPLPAEQPAVRVAVTTQPAPVAVDVAVATPPPAKQHQVTIAHRTQQLVPRLDPPRTATPGAHHVSSSPVSATAHAPALPLHAATGARAGRVTAKTALSAVPQPLWVSLADSAGAAAAAVRPPSGTTAALAGLIALLSLSGSRLLPARKPHRCPRAPVVALERPG